jgi:type II secretory pathway pseudopilin PulG
MQNAKCRRKTRRCPHSAFCILHSAFIRPAYTIVELFLTLAVLMIILGMMMNMANRVRRGLAEKLTRQVLTDLSRSMNDYQLKYKQLPPITKFGPPPGSPAGSNDNESALQILARQNNADFVRYLKLSAVAKPGHLGDDPLAESFARTGMLVDPWGSPIVFMPGEDPSIGMAPGDAFFFFSAGPDGKYLSREDNVYSYEGEK